MCAAKDDLISDGSTCSGQDQDPGNADSGMHSHEFKSGKSGTLSRTDFAEEKVECYSVCVEYIAHHDRCIFWAGLNLD